MLTAEERKLKHQNMEDYFVIDHKENKLVYGWTTHHNAYVMADIENGNKKQKRYEVINFSTAFSCSALNREQYSLV